MNPKRASLGIAKILLFCDQNITVRVMETTSLQGKSKDAYDRRSPSPDLRKLSNLISLGPQLPFFNQMNLKI